MANLKKNRPTLADFPEEGFVETIKWRDLSKGVFEIIKKKSLKTKIGPAIVLTLQDENEQTVDVWAPDRLQEELKKNPKSKWIANKGLAKCKKKPDWEFFDFQLM